MIDAIWQAKYGGSAKPDLEKAVKMVRERLGDPTIARNETRQQKWRRLHPERYRAGQAALMRRKRLDQKKAASSAPTSSE